MISEPSCTVPLPGAGIIITLELKFRGSLKQHRACSRGGEQAGGAQHRQGWVSEQSGVQLWWRRVSKRDGVQPGWERQNATKARNSGLQTAGCAPLTK
jgi:hypothetical protein